MVLIMEWLISANSKIFDHNSAFERYNYIEWRKVANYEIDDTVYIYVTAPTQKIQYKTIVTAIDLTFDEIKDYSEFWHNNVNDDKDYKYVKLELVKEFDEESLSLKSLMENGLNAAPQGPVRLDESIVNYIEGVLSSPSQNEKTIPHFRDISAKSEEYVKFKNKIIDEYEAFQRFETNKSKESGSLKSGGGKGLSYPRYLIRLGIIAEEFYNIEIDTFFSGKVLNAIERLREDFKKEFNDYNVQEGRFPNSTIDSYKDFIKYNRHSFLQEVYLSGEEYMKLHSLLKNKKNIILQGAPGVGKTFMAKRLAYSMMGVRDNDRIGFVQFHQNYNYEDFVLGYKPFEGTYRLKEGKFYNFCKQAEQNSNQKYFFIIDEINRGNISKIFGELLVGIENDYRNSSIELAYSDEEFTVPDNVYIIGMMNTADRSVALIDYALRRRFSFYEIEPAFEKSDLFKEYINKLNSDKLRSLIEKVVMLNQEIEQDPSLGKGFRIGHSYFNRLNITDDITQRLREIVEFDIVPMLEEYWFDDETEIAKWESNLMSELND